MAKLSEVGKVAAASDSFLAKREMERPDGDAAPSAFLDLAGPGPKWPKPVRISFIAAAAAGLWGLIFYAIFKLI